MENANAPTDQDTRSSTRKLALCYGTRPQVVKASVLVEALERNWDVITIDTGQHYDWELNGLHYQQLGVRPPDHYLEVGSADHVRQTAEVLLRAGETLAVREPEVVVVIGDTNSTLGCALAAAQQRRPVVHVEAGLRTKDLVLAEEVNRRVVDEISALLCAPSRAATDFLTGRAASGQEVVFTGDVARDVLRRALDRPAAQPTPWEEWGIQPPFALLTVHRAEITGRGDWLGGLLTAIAELPVPVFFPAHPRTVGALRDRGLLETLPANLRISQPVGYLEMVTWARSAEVILTDSGGLQREAYWLGVPCVTLRGETEWEETVATGANVLFPPGGVGGLAETLKKHPGRGRDWDRLAYGDGQAAELVRQAVARRFL